MDRASGKCGRSSHVKELVVLNEELDCRREVGLVLGPRVGVAGDGVELTAGWGQDTEQALTHCQIDVTQSSSRDSW